MPQPPRRPPAPQPTDRSRPPAAAPVEPGPSKKPAAPYAGAASGEALWKSVGRFQRLR